MCHGTAIQQKAVRLDSPEAVKSHAQQIYQQVVQQKLMPLNNATRGIVTAENLAHVKPGTLFINTARSEVIESGALLARLQKGDVPAALDVFDHEPLTADDAICHVPGIVLTPHVGWRADGAFKELTRQMIACLTAYFAGEDYNVVVSER